MACLHIHNGKLLLNPTSRLPYYGSKFVAQHFRVVEDYTITWHYDSLTWSTTGTAPATTNAAFRYISLVTPANLSVSSIYPYLMVIGYGTVDANGNLIALYSDATYPYVPLGEHPLAYQGPPTGLSDGSIQYFSIHGIGDPDPINNDLWYSDITQYQYYVELVNFQTATPGTMASASEFWIRNNGANLQHVSREVLLAGSFPTAPSTTYSGTLCLLRTIDYWEFRDITSSNLYVNSTNYTFSQGKLISSADVPSSCTGYRLDIPFDGTITYPPSGHTGTSTCLTSISYSTSSHKLSASYAQLTWNSGLLTGVSTSSSDIHQAVEEAVTFRGGNRPSGRLVFKASSGRLCYSRQSPNWPIVSRTLDPDDPTTYDPCDPPIYVTIAWGSDGDDLDICGYWDTSSPQDSDCVGWSYSRATQKTSSNWTLETYWAGDNTSVGGQEYVTLQIKGPCPSSTFRYDIRLNYYGWDNTHNAKTATITVKYPSSNSSSGNPVWTETAPLTVDCSTRAHEKALSTDPGVQISLQRACVGTCTYYTNVTTSKLAGTPTPPEPEPEPDPSWPDRPVEIFVYSTEDNSRLVCCAYTARSSSGAAEGYVGYGYNQTYTTNAGDTLEWQFNGTISSAVTLTAGTSEVSSLVTTYVRLYLNDYSLSQTSRCTFAIRYVSGYDSSGNPEYTYTTLSSASGNLNPANHSGEATSSDPYATIILNRKVIAGKGYYIRPGGISIHNTGQ